METSVYDKIRLLLLYTNLNSDAGEASHKLIHVHFFRLGGSHEVVQVRTWWYNGQQVQKAFDHTRWHALQAAYEIKIH